MPAHDRGPQQHHELGLALLLLRAAEHPAMPVDACVMSFGRSSPEIITVLPSMTRVTVSAPVTRISGVDAFMKPCF